MFLRNTFTRHLKSLRSFTVRHRSDGGGPLLENLPNRGVLKLSGRDLFGFLQGLITNDINLICEHSSIYTLFLNAKGRVLYDGIIFKGEKEGELYVESDLDSLNSLESHMMMFRVRKKVEIVPLKDLSVWVLYKEDGIIAKDSMPSDGLISAQDPRLPQLGVRILVPKDDVLTDRLKEGFELRQGSFMTHR